jgi:hypothetical protein
LHGLGRVLKEYRPRRYGLRLAIASVILLCGIVLATLASRYTTYTRGGTEEDPGPVRTYKLYVWGQGVRDAGFLTSIAAGLCTLYYLLHTLRGFNLRAVLCEKGLLYQRWWRKVPCPWTDIESVYYARRPQWLVFSWYSYFLEINTRHGATIRFPSPLNVVIAPLYGQQLVQLALQILLHALCRSPFPNMEEIGKAIEREATAAILPRVQAALKGGEKVAFGILEMDPHGLSYGKSTLAWGRVGQLRINPVTFSYDQLQISEADGRSWAQIPVAQIGNLEVLLKVLKARLGKGVARTGARGA